ncbi:MOXD1 homolog 1-like [Aplysia californica]|uniref:MOXD1 homolog 1-like n=1 Tax=Aplysia californica TaxID=6500 RepID=A0ABM0JTF2_APLCA|nr:MOXD1 homolog 1-like [Aplysia californica]
MTFDLPSDQDYHIIAYEPLIDNANVLHHILLYGCTDPNGVRIPAPESCGMSQSNNDCNTIIGLWAVGVPGVCLPENLGFRIGASGYQRVRLETHWNNPAGVTNYRDSSGLRLYYRPSLPQIQDLLTFMTGQRILKIPPGESRVEQIGTCPSDCTRALFAKPAYVISVFNHMHYLGRAMKIELFRNGRLIKELSNEDYYSYDNPIQHDHQPPVQILPGDEIKTTCVFNSLSSDRWVYWGDGTNDEMCFGFLTMYPRDALPIVSASCVSMGPASTCDFYGPQKTSINGCDWKTFTNGSHPETDRLWEKLEKNCNLDGFCRPECREITDELKKHPCMQGEVGDLVNFRLVRSHEGSQFLGRVHSCPTRGQDPGGVDCRTQCADVCYDDVRDSAPGSSAMFGVVSSLFAIVRLTSML